MYVCVYACVYVGVVITCATSIEYNSAVLYV